MADQIQWAFPSELQPDAGTVDFDLAAALDAVVALRAEIPDDAFTASALGTGRSGNGVVIGEDGLVLTIGYLITEAEALWLTTNSGTVVAGHALAYDPVTGLGLVLPLGRLGVAPIARCRLDEANLDGDVYVVGRGGQGHALRAQVFARREFAGYWEYLLDQALFTTPAHPEWSGAALLDGSGRLAGIGSLFVQEPDGDEVVKGNMFVPSELIDPDPRRHAASRLRRSSAARVARRLLGRDAGRNRDPGPGAGRASRACGRAAGRHRARCRGERRSRASRSSTAASGTAVPPAPRSR